MKIIFFVVRYGVLFLLALNLFFWAIAHGTGHSIPSKTNWALGLSSAVLLLVFLASTFFYKKYISAKKR